MNISHWSSQSLVRMRTMKHEFRGTTSTPSRRVSSQLHSRGLKADMFGAMCTCKSLRIDPPQYRAPLYIPINHSISLPSLIAAFQAQMTTRPCPPVRGKVKLANEQSPWTGEEPLTVAFSYDQLATAGMLLRVGRCTSSQDPGAQLGPIYATVHAYGYEADLLSEHSHHCSTDHVLDWSGLKNPFKVRAWRFMNVVYTSRSPKMLPR
ncbi:hypothetical protein C8Q80DRAFT_912653 [Daedaleopsis nitida]|nr:hypothetical protein C8Q80DRAFT_912653 [Daedaleopsis nitida]